MRIGALASAAIGTSLLLTTAGISLPSTADAALPQPAIRSAAATAPFRAAVFDAGRGVRGIDLTDKGKVLLFEKGNATSAGGYVVVARHKHTVLQTQTIAVVDGHSRTLNAIPQALSDSGRVGGFGDWSDPSGPLVNANDGLVTWATPSSPLVEPACGDVCRVDMQDPVRDVWLNKSGNLLFQSAQLHLGKHSVLVDPSGKWTNLSASSDHYVPLSVAGISNKNVVAASAPSNPNAPYPHASLLSGNTLTPLPEPADTLASWTTAISPSGNWVTGYWEDTSNKWSYLSGSILLWNRKHQYQVISGLPKNFQVTKVNNSGWIIGDADGVDYLIRNGQAAPLSNLASLPSSLPAASKMCQAVAVNSAGKILVNVCDADGNPSSVLLLTPSK